MKEKDEGQESWVQYQKLVLAELERHSGSLDSINMRIATIQVEIAMLKVKSGIWGVMGGLIPVVVAFAVQHYGSK